ncbi:MAG: PKD domain-containing protein [Pseudomonadota bacterium]
MGRLSLAALIVASLANACSSGGGSDGGAPPPAQNLPPVADAGSNLTADEGTTVTFDGSASADADGSVRTFSWTQVSGTPGRLFETDAATLSFTAPSVSVPTALGFSLRVTDDAGASASDAVSVTVEPAPLATAVEVPIAYDGKDRVYTLVTPTGYAPGGTAVMLLHGGTGSMRQLLEADNTPRRWAELAELHGFLLIVPNGFNEDDGDGLGDRQSWNDLRAENNVNLSTEDDVGFLLAVLDDADARADFDNGRVFVTGSSNGGIMSMTMLILHPDRFAGAAAFIAALPEEAIPDPAAPTPIMLLNGTEDPLILFDGGPVGANGSPTRSVPATVAYWEYVNGAVEAAAVDVSIPENRSDDGCTIFGTAYPDAAGDPAVTFYRAEGGFHSIPDPDPPFRSPAVEAVVGPSCFEAHGVDLAWSFFQSVE